MPHRPGPAKATTMLQSGHGCQFVVAPGLALVLAPFICHLLVIGRLNCPYSTSELQLSIPAVCFGFFVIDSGYLSAMLTTTLFWGGDSKRQRYCNAGLSASDM